MKSKSLLLVNLMFFLAVNTAVALQPDAANCKDHPLIPSRMPGYSILSCKTEAFGMYDFYTLKGPRTHVEGRFTFITYLFTGNRPEEPGALAVVRNYENAITRAGGKIVGINPTWWVVGNILQNGSETWIQAEKGNGKIWLRIVEKQAMDQVIKMDAAASGKVIGVPGTGRVTLPGSMAGPEKMNAIDAQTVVVPNVVGLPMTEAVAVLAQFGLEQDDRRPSTDGEGCRIYGTGVAVEQDPVAGTRVAPHSSVKLSWCD
jgi:hypothetical protein